MIILDETVNKSKKHISDSGSRAFTEVDRARKAYWSEKFEEEGIDAAIFTYRAMTKDSEIGPYPPPQAPVLLLVLKAIGEETSSFTSSATSMVKSFLTALYEEEGWSIKGRGPSLHFQQILDVRTLKPCQKVQFVNRRTGGIDVRPILKRCGCYAHGEVASEIWTASGPFYVMPEEAFAQPLAFPF